MSDLETTDAAMDLSRDDDNDFWRHQDDDDDGGSRRGNFTKHNEEEDEEGGRRSTLIKFGDDAGGDQVDEEQKGEGGHVDKPDREGDVRMEEGGEGAPTENGVSATSAEKKKKKKSEDGEKKSKKKKKKKKGESEKENMECARSSSRSGLESEEDEVPAPTPPLFNGHAITNGLTHHSTQDILLKDDTFSDRELQSDHEAFTKEDFHSLVEVYNKESTPKKELRAQTPLSDEDDLAGVSVKQLRVSYLSAAQHKGQQSTNNYKCNSKSEIKADLNTSVNISSLVGTYSSPQPRPATPCRRPDDLTPVSLRSLKSVYEATATASSGAGSRCSSSGSSSPASGSPAPKEELNISLQQLREEYCRSVQDGHTHSLTPTRTPPDTGVSIKQLTRSMTDLRVLDQAINSSIIEGDRVALATVNVKALTRSFSDLTRLYEPIVSSPLCARPQHDIPPRSVFVKKLRASYGDLPRLLSDSESGGHSSSSLRLQSRLHTMDPFPLYSLLHLHDNHASQVSSECKMCGKQVFQMEKIVAEKAAWHKNCFRCKECNSLLTLETYQSHEGVLYCKPHFKDLFRPKAVIEDPDEARKERLMRRPKMIVLESKPEALPDDVVRSTVKPDYGLEELSSANLKQKFAMFEQISTEEEHRPEPISVRRSHSLLNRAAKFMHLEDDDYGVENSELGEYEEYDEDEDEEEEDEEGEEGDAENSDKIKTKKGRPTSFSGIQDLKAGWAQKNRREEMSRKRREELSKFRQMLCAGKNITTREMFESGNFEEQEKHLKRKEPIAIEGRPAAKNLRDRFEKGLSMNEDEEDENGERREVDNVLKNAETASKARNLFKKIDSAVSEEGSEPVMRPRSSAQARKENRLSRDGVDVEEQELGRDPNLIRCTDNYQDEVDCRKTRSVLAMFKKMEMQSEEEDRGPRPLKRFTPPPEGEGEDDSEEEDSSDEEYSDEDEEDNSEEDEDDEENDRKPKYKDEILEMVNSSQSAKKAASLRAKFEKWETEVERNNEYNRGEIPEGEEECMPSIDTARNLRAMFENKAQEASRPVTNRPKIKVNRFV